jgi:hypothetical protein
MALFVFLGCVGYILYMKYQASQGKGVTGKRNDNEEQAVEEDP